MPVASTARYETRRLVLVQPTILNRDTPVTPESERVAEWGEHGSEPGQLDRPARMALDAEGQLLVVDSLNRVQRFTLVGEYIDGFGTYGDAPGEFDMSWGIAVDAEGCIYVGDWRNDRVQKLSPTGEPIDGDRIERGR